MERGNGDGNGSGNGNSVLSNDGAVAVAMAVVGVVVVVVIITNNGSIYLLHLRCVALRSSTQLRIQSVNYDRMIIIKIALVQFVVI